MSRPKKEEYVPRSISEGKPSPLCISVELFLEMERTIKEQREEIERLKEELLKMVIDKINVKKNEEIKKDL